MRAIAACQFTLSRFEVWRRTVAVFAGAVLLALLLWFIGRPVALPWKLVARGSTSTGGESGDGVP